MPDPNTARHGVRQALRAEIGQLAATPNTGDHGSSNVTPPYVVTPLDGLRAALDPHGIGVQYDDGTDPARAAQVAWPASCSARWRRPWLPFTIPVSEDHLPLFDPAAGTVEYGPLHGQQLLDHLGVPAAYPYGFGLTYA